MADQPHKRTGGHVFTVALGQHVLVPEDQLVELLLHGVVGDFVAGDLHRWPVQQDPVQLHVRYLRCYHLQAGTEIRLGDISFERCADQDAFLGHARRMPRICSRLSPKLLDNHVITRANT